MEEEEGGGGVLQLTSLCYRSLYSCYIRLCLKKWLIVAAVAVKRYSQCCHNLNLVIWIIFTLFLFCFIYQITVYCTVEGSANQDLRSVVAGSGNIAYVEKNYSSPSDPVGSGSFLAGSDSDTARVCSVG